MYPIPARCPICGGELYAARLVCQQCTTALEGTFSLQQLTQLMPEQWGVALDQLAALKQDQLEFALKQLPQLSTEQWNFLQRLARLNPEQWAFVETFLRCEGRLNRVQEEMGLSYPTIRNRLDEVIRALGYEVSAEGPLPPTPPTPPTPPAPPRPPRLKPEERQSILDSLANAQIDVEEAVRRLRHGREE